jgi:hypothetical protein
LTLNERAATYCPNENVNAGAPVVAGADVVTGAVPADFVAVFVPADFFFFFLLSFSLASALAVCEGAGLAVLALCGAGDGEGAAACAGGGSACAGRSTGRSGAAWIGGEDASMLCPSGLPDERSPTRAAAAIPTAISTPAMTFARELAG